MRIQQSVEYIPQSVPDLTPISDIPFIYTLRTEIVCTIQNAREISSGTLIEHLIDLKSHYTVYKLYLPLL
jgi:hypothetical protein